MKKFWLLVLSPFHKLIRSFGRIWDKFALPATFGSYGKDVHICEGLTVAGNHNIYFGNHVAVGPNCTFYSTRAKLSIGNFVLISPNVTIVTGEHRIDVVGVPMYCVGDQGKQNRPDLDKDVTIGDDVWIGANVVILKGVTIGEGAIIHAGQVISRSVPPYTIYYNEKIQVARFSESDIKKHQKELHEKYEQR